jgi:Protein of unknown function (DUF3375)
VTAPGAVTADGSALDMSRMFEQLYVDPERLVHTVRHALRQRRQVGLAQVLADQPLEQGLAELVGYLSLTGRGFDVVFDERFREQVSWQDSAGQVRVAEVPRVVFARSAAEGSVPS